MEFLHELLDKTSIYKIRILYILKNKSDFIGLDELSKISGLERRTLEGYIDELYKDYLEFVIEPSKLSLTILGKKIKMDYHLYEDFYYFQMYIISNSFSIKLLSNLLLGDTINTTRYLAEYFISKSTLQRRVNNIRMLLNIYDIKLSNTKGELHLIGDEAQIRILAYTFFWILYKGKSWPFPVKKNQIENMQIELFHPYDNQLSKTNIEDSLFILAINTIRYRKGYTINFSQLEVQELLFEDFVLYKNNWEKKYYLSSNEYFFFLLVLQTQSKFYLDKQLKTPILELHKKFRTSIYKSVETFFSYFSKSIYFISASQKEKFYTHILANHLFCFLFKTAPVGIFGHPTVSNVNTRFPKLTLKLEQLISQLYKETGLTIFENQKFLIPNYALFFASIQNIAYFETEISIFIDTDLPILAEERLRNLLFHFLEGSYNIKIVNSIDKLKKSSFDLVLTSSFVPEIKSASKDEQLIYITEELRIEDLVRINEALFKIRQKKNSYPSES
ncbi:hypothetical protein UAY_02742 [Enterococcus moraviensis ATCC BAA-383]|uniref:Mga helix-turn-helix domain-containing protein n=1 Tax=Enterococcus moraviensis ATCC BAA-383 TaxID=1158609 RepID=R2SP88_9ENTE|nr:helix-turn-helix domain-containing protein [Enterococcus moraviensis]EOH97010.1 hypothetical protein UAY_02742 [Enterococcus moraviensis ATCC BAA-383]EOT65800.1 hypothetical protein I586_02069 [Enterococcus moraviensis ATCC BAA-383]OJG68428.1 hypothetical protein RV09_GL001675 [Enterococcus moraviensis]